MCLWQSAPDRSIVTTLVPPVEYTCTVRLNVTYDTHGAALWSAGDTWTRDQRARTEGANCFGLTRLHLATFVGSPRLTQADATWVNLLQPNIYTLLPVTRLTAGLLLVLGQVKTCQRWQVYKHPTTSIFVVVRLQYRVSFLIFESLFFRKRSHSPNRFKKVDMRMSWFWETENPVVFVVHQHIWLVNTVHSSGFT